MKRTEQDRERLAQRLRKEGIAPTHQRMEIAQLLFERMQHLSADEVLALVNARYAETSKATVYNTLRLFVQKGLIRELIVDPSKVVYDTHAEPHHHVYNTSTGQLTDIAADGVRVVGLPPLPAEVEAVSVDIIVRTRPRA
jgi:Fur family iron response transcriptional regulator